MFTEFKKPLKLQKLRVIFIKKVVSYHKIMQIINSTTYLLFFKIKIKKTGEGVVSFDISNDQLANRNKLNCECE